MNIACCICLMILILLAILLVCGMVKFSFLISVDDQKPEQIPRTQVFQLSRPVGIITLANDTSAAAARFPYVAAIISNSSDSWSFACFASIILNKWVITSAHCRKPGATHRVLLYHDFTGNYSQTYPIVLWRLHENFNLSDPSSKFDIAVAKINVERNPFPIKPAVFDEKKKQMFEASIWKTVLTMDKKMYLTNDFETFDMVLAKQGKCFETYGIEMDDSLICVDLSAHDVCFVHEFGPIFYMDKLVGVLAVKPRDCDVKLAVFTNVSFYSSWVLRWTRITYHG